MVNAASGTIVSLLVLTAAPDEALPLPVLASALVAALRAELPAMLAAVAALVAVLLAVVGRDRADHRVGRLRAAGRCRRTVLTQMSFSVSGLCQ